MNVIFENDDDIKNIQTNADTYFYCNLETKKLQLDIDLGKTQITTKFIPTDSG